MKKMRKSEPASPRRVALFLTASAVIVAVGLAVLGLFGDAGGKPPRAAIEVRDAPRLKVDRDVVDLGQVRLGNDAYVAFTASNVGDRPLQFTSPPYVQLMEGC